MNSQGVLRITRRELFLAKEMELRLSAYFLFGGFLLLEPEFPGVKVLGTSTG